MEQIKKRKELIISIIITLVFFIIFNMVFQLRYEEVDDFVMMTLISGADSDYSIYGIFIHPLLCTIIMLLFKTGISINWYTIVILLIQFASFTAIGTVLIKKNDKIGAILYLFLISVIYSKLLLYIQFTSTAALALTAGIILIIYSREKEESKNKFFIYGLIFIAIGSMLRFNSYITTMPYLVIYYIYDMIKNKKIKRNIVDIAIIIGVLLSVYISNQIIYYANPTCREYIKFNKVRSSLHDTKIPEYKNNEEEILNEGWSLNDIDVFYSHLFADEEKYNLDNIKKLLSIKKQIEEHDILNDVKYALDQYKEDVVTNYAIPTILFMILILISINRDKEKQLLIAMIFIMTIGMHIGFWYIGRAPTRVVISGYVIGISLTMYFFPKLELRNKITKILIAILIVISIFAIFKNTLKDSQKININNFSSLRQAINYTNQHKENVYLYTTLSMRYRFFCYTVYEKIPDDTFSNLQPTADWSIYTENYYKFKERYNLNNLITDLYLKDNMYLIDDARNRGIYLNRIKQYIKEHYNINVKFEETENFNNKIKIYKVMESSEI